jgi:hypothetical protein
MISSFGTMYLRPGNLWKDFQVRTMQTEWSGCHTTDTYADTGEHVTGILAAADSHMSDRMKHRWDQDQHSLTHTLLIRGRAGLKKGDMLILEERAFLVLLLDDVGALGVSGIVYLEERNDIK